MTKRLTVSAILAALSIVLIYTASVTPSLRLALTAAAGLIPSVIVINSGIKRGFLFYGAVSMLALLISPSKDIAIAYFLVFGHYPMFKSLIERLNRLWLEWLVKILFFNAVAIACYFTVYIVVGPDVIHGLAPALEGMALPLIFLILNVVFVIYDLGFSKLIRFYRERIEKFIK